MMKRLFKYFPIILLSLIITSCLEHDLEDLPMFTEANITKMQFEYRWTNDASTYGKLELKKLSTSATIDTVANTVSCVITVPAAKDDFTEEIRSQVTQSNIVGYADLSTAAVMRPIGDSPVLGTVGDFSKSNIQYEVEAADGSVKVWTIVITDFNK